MLGSMRLAAGSGKKMIRKEVLAERILFLKDEAGAKRKIAVRIGAPYWIRRSREAACSVEIYGLYEDLADIHGVDFFQAIELAITFVSKLLAARRSKHQKLYWPNGTEYSPLTPSRRPRRKSYR